jgi:hypothetical protein
MSKLLTLSVALLLAGSGARAGAQELKLTRDVTSGAEARIAVDKVWGNRDCQAQPISITVTRPPQNGEISVRDTTTTIPDSTRKGSTGPCAGKPVNGKQILYRSKPGFRGVDTVTYRMESASGKTKTTNTITINVR